MNKNGLFAFFAIIIVASLLFFSGCGSSTAEITTETDAETRLAVNFNYLYNSQDEFSGLVYDTNTSIVYWYTSVRGGHDMCPYIGPSGNYCIYLNGIISEIGTKWQIDNLTDVRE